MTNYEMVRGPDGIVWVTVQPLIYQVKQILENSKQIKTTGMDENEKRAIDFTILSLEATYNFLKSLMAEQEIKEAIQQESR